jgi:hypothetical protein
MLGSWGRRHFTDRLPNARTLRGTGVVFMREHKCGRVSDDRWEWDMLETVVLRKPGSWLAECFPQYQYLYCFRKFSA